MIRTSHRGEVVSSQRSVRSSGSRAHRGQIQRKRAGTKTCTGSSATSSS